MPRRFPLLFSALIALGALMGSAAELDGTWQIVVPVREESGVSAALSKVAQEMGDVIAEGTGVRPRVLSVDAFAGGHAIFLGAAAAEKAGLLPDDLQGYDNVYAEKDGNVYLFGLDTSGRSGTKNTYWGHCRLPTAKAVVRFLEDVLDVRFLAPGKVGFDISKRKSWTLKDGTFSRHRPRQVYGSGRIDSSILYSYAANIFGSGSFYSYGGHSYPAACPGPMYYKDHPEYFALVGGKRKYYKSNASLCISNPAVADLMVEELCRRFDAGADYCQLGQQDGDEYCSCQSCRDLYGTGDDWGEKLWLFHRSIAERIEKLRPGKVVHIMSYGATAHPPKSFKVFPSNVMIEQCRASEEAFREWDGYMVPHGFTVYIYLWGEYPTLGLTAKHSYASLADFVQTLHRNKVCGIYRCGYGEFFGTEGPGYYVFNALLDRPDADVDGLVSEYCARAYGPAATAMRRFHDTLDRRLRGVDRIERRTGVRTNGVNPSLRNAFLENPFSLLAYVYAPEVVSRLDDNLARAEGTAGLTEKQKIRLSVVRREYEYARNLGRIASFYGAYRLAPTEASFNLLADELEKRTALVADLLKGQKAVPRLPEWPEIRFFGSFVEEFLRLNGRLGAKLDAPLTWDVKFLRDNGFLPGAKTMSLSVKSVDAAPEGLDFEKGLWARAAWQQMLGCQMQRVDLKGRFKALAGPEALYLAVETDLADDYQVKPLDRDGPVWRQDNLDLMIDATFTREAYRHFVWIPSEGSFYDAALGHITNPLDPKFNTEDPDWNSDFSFRTARENGVWRSCVKIPYASLGVRRPVSGEKWYVNLGRGANFGTRSIDERYLLWQPNFVRANCLCDVNALGIFIFE